MGEDGETLASIAAFFRAGLASLVGDSFRFKIPELKSGDICGMEGGSGREACFGEAGVRLRGDIRVGIGDVGSLEELSL
jgi:hypothetical protein